MQTLTSILKSVDLTNINVNIYKQSIGLCVCAMCVSLILFPSAVSGRTTSEWVLGTKERE